MPESRNRWERHIWIPAFAGMTFGHKTQGSNGNSWTIPLGLTTGRTFDMGGGHGFDIGIGGYHLPSWGRPKGGAKYQLKLGLTWIFPR